MNTSLKDNLKENLKGNLDNLKGNLRSAREDVLAARKCENINDPVDTHFVDYIAMVFSKLFIKLHIIPNVVTMLSMASGDSGFGAWFGKCPSGFRKRLPVVSAPKGSSTFFVKNPPAPLPASTTIRSPESGRSRPAASVIFFRRNAA